MSYDLQVRQRQDNLPEIVDPYALHEGDGQGEPHEGVFVKLHRLLRGRYHWAVLLGLVLGSGGGYYGYTTAKKPTWSSTGTIHIRPWTTPVVRPSELTGDMRSYQSYVLAQVAFLRSQDVIDAALKSPEWNAVNRPVVLDEAYQEFMGSLQVSAGGDEMVRVTFTDPDKQACTAAVTGVIKAYNERYLLKEKDEQDKNLRTLEVFRDTFEKERNDKRKEIHDIAVRCGTDDLRPVHADMQIRLNQKQSERDRIVYKLKLADRIAMSPTPRAMSTTMPSKQPGIQGKTAAGELMPPPKLGRDMTVSDIALVDQRMRQLYDEYGDAEIRVSIDLEKKGENHPLIKEARSSQRARWQSIERYAEKWRQSHANTPYGGEELDPDPTAISVRQLKDAKQEYEEDIAALEKEIKKINEPMLAIERLRSEEREKDRQLAEVVARLEIFRTESKATPRVSIVSLGDRPVPLKDPRPKTAVTFGMGGFGLGVAFVIFLSLLDRRMRSLDDAKTSFRLPLLGILPDLPQDLADPEQASMAAHCVHQIRTLLQVGHRGDERRSFAITSPAAGTGKTSLTLALGVSFAAASSKTLIIDCDVIGGGLTARVEKIIRRKIGQILKRDGTITEQQLETALRLARNSQRKLGEILIELGYLTIDDVDRALTAQQDEAPVGILEALAGEPIEDCVAETGIQGLCILPIGAASPTDVSKLSPQVVRDLVARAREQFDIILIDTGPVPGSLEASAAATAADGVILVVSRGEHRPLVEKSLRYLQDLGARLSGMVFNRAGTRDVDAATSTTRITSFDRSGRSAPPPQEHIDSKFGPVAGAVATSSPASKAGTRPQQP